MGLPDKERTKGIYYGIDKIVSLAEDIKGREKDYNYPGKLINLIDLLWDSFIGANHNSSHWILGSSATNEVTYGSNSPWGVAINHHCFGILNKKEKDIFEDKEFNALHDFLDIPGLLQQYEGNSREIHEIYAYSEQIVYYLRRYDDEFLNKLKWLSKVISNIQGECFTLFKSNECYARAYVLHNILKKLYCNSYPYRRKGWDVLTEYIQANHMHHNLNLMMQPRDSSLKELAEIHTQIQKAYEEKKLTLFLRIEIFFKLVGRKYYYDHQFKDLLERLKGKITREQEKKMRGWFEGCKRAHKQNEKESQERYESGKFPALSIYDL